MRPSSLGRITLGLIVSFYIQGSLSALAAMISRDECVNRWRHQQGEQRADTHPGCNDNSDCKTTVRASSLSDDERNHSDDHGCRGHEDWAKPHGRRMFDCLAATDAFLILKLVGEFDH